MKGNQLQARLKGIEEKKIDEKVIEGIRGHIKKLNKDLGEGLEGKLQK